MSTIRHFDIPHIVRFGRQSDEKRETWMLFYRAATCFEVTIHGANIANTPFEAAWSRTAFYKSTPGNFVQKWNDFCDCVIGEILPTLQELVPVGVRSWNTLEDYIQTANYKLSLHKAPASSDSDSNSNQIKVHIDEGPTFKPAFEIHPEPISTLPFDLPPPSSLPQIPASTLQVLNHHKDLRQRPYKVRLPDAGVAYLITTNGPVKSMPAGTINNPSLATIQTQLNLHRLFENPETPREALSCIPKPLAIVTTDSTEDIHPNITRDSLSSTEHAPSPLAPAPASASTPPTHLTALLTTYLPRAKPLSDPTFLSTLTTSPSPSPDLTRHTLSHTLKTTISTLHTQDPPIIHGNINPYTIMLTVSDSDSDSASRSESTFQPYLVGFSPDVANNLFIDPSAAGTKEADMQGLESTFGESGWLVHEIKKAKGQVSMDQRWEKTAKIG